MKTIVVAVDFSNATPGVLEMAVRVARSFGASLRLFHAIEPEPSYTAYGFVPDEFPAMNAFQAEAKRRAAIKLEELLTTVRAAVPKVASENLTLADGIAATVQSLGYRLAFTIESGHVSCTDNPFGLRRVSIHDGMTRSTPMFLARLTGLF